MGDIDQKAWMRAQVEARWRALIAEQNLREAPRNLTRIAVQLALAQIAIEIFRKSVASR